MSYLFQPDLTCSSRSLPIVIIFEEQFFIFFSNNLLLDFQDCTSVWHGNRLQFRFFRVTMSPVKTIMAP